MDIPAARMTDPLTRTIVEENYPDSGLTQKQLALVSEAVHAEVDRFSVGPWSSFRHSVGRRPP